MKFLSIGGNRFLGSACNATRGFSLIEVTIALGLVTFALVAIIGLIPLGLQQEKNSSEQLRGMQILSEVANDIYSVAKKYQDPAASVGPGNYLSVTNKFGITLNPPGGGAADGTFGVDENFAKVPANDTNARETVYYSYPAATNSYDPYNVHVVVAWPGRAEISTSGQGVNLTHQTGYVETVLTVNRL